MRDLFHLPICPTNKTETLFSLICNTCQRSVKCELIQSGTSLISVSLYKLVPVWYRPGRDRMVVDLQLPMRTMPMT